MQGTTTRRGVLVAAGVAGAVGAGAAVSARGRGAAPPAYAARPRTDRPPRWRPPADRTNVVVVSIDDLGWNELGCYGHPFNRTPEIDRLAAEGLRFTRAYAAAPTCSPTRAALMTGRYPGRVGVTDYLRPEPAASDRHLDAGHSTVPRVLARRGYTSGLVGKWHLSETYSGPYRDRPGGPWAHGFDEVRASEELYIAGGDYTHPYFFLPTLAARESVDGRPEYLTDRLALEAEDFIAAHRDEPFFLHVSNYAVHIDHEAPADVVARYAALPGADEAPNRPVVAAMLDRIDAQVGRIRRALEENGLTRRTLVLVTSDNGSDDRAVNAPLRDGKGSLHEGGIRVPLVAWGPGLVRAGRTTDHPTSTIDVLPTAADLAGARDVPGRLDDARWDGVSLVPVLSGRGRQRSRAATFWVYPHHFVPDTRPQAAVLAGDHKLVMMLRDRSVALYDLAADEAETTDLAARRPRVAARLTRLLEDHLAELDLLPDPPGRPDRRRPVAPGDDGPRGTAWELVADPGDLASGDTVSLGLASGPGERLLLTYDHDRRGVRWDLVVGGRPVTVGMEPLGQIDGTVGLDRRPARLGLVGRGSEVAAYVDERGAGWEFLARLDVAGVLDLRDDAVRRRLRWATDGAVEVGGLTARDR
ncbi:sulfatase [Nocardioides sp. CFH 31398]|uniref:sulfatase n=1 Tax=Nocardioides sp. CFH 31398 TaxID=2919579 RepID=UPI001F065DA7|nr:sulfatase [Nocardioides sp. CFH 31398]MCH1865777.1 sulfatase [Nocardioides sp. CFH 31398]